MRRAMRKFRKEWRFCGVWRRGEIFLILAVIFGLTGFAEPYKTTALSGDARIEDDVNYNFMAGLTG